MKRLLKLSFVIPFWGLAACSPDSAEIISQKPLVQQERPQYPGYDSLPEQQFNWITEDGGQSQLDFNPAVDILFVTDNSDSMKAAQENLVNNLSRFTAGISRNKMIDYHIGVTSTWDSSERYAQMKKDNYQIGDLRFIKDASGQQFNKRYVSKKDAPLLASTLNIGVLPYAQGGPEIEEFFSPLAAALEKSGRGGVNEGFFRQEAQLVVVIMTDADDSTSRISPEQMAQTLIDFKGGKREKVSVYGVTVRTNDPDEIKDWDLKVHPKYHPECFDRGPKGAVNNGRCSGFGSARIEEMILKANEHAGTADEIREKYIMSLGSKNFGADLGKIGENITVRTLEKEIFLSQRPRVENNEIKVRVRYGTPAVLAKGGGQVLPQRKNGGWLYDPANNSVRLSGDIAYQYQEGGRFAVDLIPVTLAK